MVIIISLHQINFMANYVVFVRDASNHQVHKIFAVYGEDVEAYVNRVNADAGLSKGEPQMQLLGHVTCKNPDNILTEINKAAEIANKWIGLPEDKTWKMWKRLSAVVRELDARDVEPWEKRTMP